ncbi:hypothetical protein F5146DRAFT_1062948 [Armillaria mellea]|nr:hypothetical protein F5146DRAFT_1062948 [Armillaria mellea]
MCYHHIHCTLQVVTTIEDPLGFSSILALWMSLNVTGVLVACRDAEISWRIPLLSYSDGLLFFSSDDRMADTLPICPIPSNSDIAGIGVRISTYLQACLALLIVISGCGPLIH